MTIRTFAFLETTGICSPTQIYFRGVCGQCVGIRLQGRSLDFGSGDVRWVALLPLLSSLVHLILPLLPSSSLFLRLLLFSKFLSINALSPFETNVPFFFATVIAFRQSSDSSETPRTAHPSAPLFCNIALGISSRLQRYTL